MLDPSALKTMNVLFATPCYISAVTMNYTTSMFALGLDASHFGLPCALHMHSESLITRGRNVIVQKFLANEAFTHLFWIDSDIEFSSQAVFRLLLADRDVVAGVYPIKSLNWPAEGVSGGLSLRQFEYRYATYAFNQFGGPAGKLAPHVDAEGFAEVVEAPNGFMVVKRHVFTDMMERYPHLKYTPDGPPGHPLEHLHWRFYDCMVDPETGRYLSEDFAFCRLWRETGGKVFIDLDCKLGHLGQHMYRGDLAESLRVQGRW